jgi:putative membrane protein
LLAHEGEPVAPHDLWRAWSFEPNVVVPLLLAALLYWRGCRKDAGRWFYWGGWWLTVGALASPLHAAGGALFSAHMLQHEVLILGAAPLLVWSRPLVPMLWGLPRGWRRPAGQVSKIAAVQRSWGWATDPTRAWYIHGAAVWLWHEPRLFQATLTSEWVHTVQHLSFFLTALVFWWAMFHGHRRDYGAGVFSVFTTAIHTSVLGALLTFSTRAWYPAYAASAARWGLGGLEDQQLGGLIMWVPGGVVYTVVGLGLFTGWLKESHVE